MQRCRLSHRFLAQQLNDFLCLDIPGMVMPEEAGYSSLMTLLADGRQKHLITSPDLSNEAHKIFICRNQI